MKKLLVLAFLLASCSALLFEKEVFLFLSQKKRSFAKLFLKLAGNPFFFESVNEQAGKFQLAEIRSKPLPESDLEVRIWIGFGLAYLQGFILNRTASEWSATYLSAHKQTEKKLQAPKSSWETTWQKLVNADLLTLPDADEINCSVNGTDGTGYVVEYNANNTYRTYLYSNPDYPICKEAKQMIQIRNIIAEEFDILGKIKFIEPPPEIVERHKYFNEIKKRERSK